MKSIFILIVCAGTVMAQGTNELARLQKIYQENIAKIEGKFYSQNSNLPLEYDKELNVLEEALVKKGDLDGVMVVKKERERRKSNAGGALIPEGALVQSPAELATLQDKYKYPRFTDELNREYIALSEKYISYLEKTKVALTQSRKLDEALVYKTEIENIRKVLNSMFGTKSNNVTVAKQDTNTEVKVSEVAEQKANNTLVINLGDNIVMEFVKINKGEFMMGSTNKEDKLELYGDTKGLDVELYHKVVLTKDYWMGVYEVTQEQWEKIMGNNPSHKNYIGPKVPVSQVTWTDCQNFANKLNIRLSEFKLPVGYCFRLPTEAEWEYACKAGTTTRYPNGDDPNNYKKVAGGYGPIDKLDIEPNAWGLYNMNGGVREWCYDYYGIYDKNKYVNPLTPKLNGTRVLRAGINNSKKTLWPRSSSRNGMDPDETYYTIGLRLVIAQKITSK